jgi:hypothetical protein
MVRSLSVRDCEKLMNEVLELNTAESIEYCVRWRLKEFLMGISCEFMLDALFDDPSIAGKIEDVL